MSEPASPCAALLDGLEPLAGSTFVSTYPPFSAWTEEAVTAFRRALAAASPPGGPPLGLYVHVPFCIERCQYCYYLSHADRVVELDGYLEALLAELRLYARQPALAGRAPDFVYFGGGTPSLLSAARIRRLLEGLQQILPWSSAREVSFECAPRSVTQEKLDALRALGVTRLSLGVQSLDDEVLQRNGRVHLSADVERAYAAVRGTGFDVVNLDLMVGLVGESEASFQATLERVIALAPESVTIYQLEIPLNTPLYRALHAGELDEEPVGWDVKRARLRAGFERLERAGYTVRSGYAAVRDPARHAFVYQDAQYRGADLLGIGCSAFSHLAGVNQQNLAALDPYLAALSRGELPLWRAYELSARERAVRELVLQLKLGRVERAPFARRHGVDVVAEHAEALRELETRGLVTVDAEAITLTREGLLRVDRLLPAFYLPEHHGIRYS